MTKPKYSYGVCGVSCEMCAAGNGRISELATELLRLTKGDHEWAKNTVDFKFDDYYKALKWFSKMKCPTCQQIKEPWCEVRKCKKAKKLKSCLLCDTFMTCSKTKYQRGRYPFVIKHHKRVKKVGLEKHLAEERKRAQKGIILHDIRKY
jgi:hypothetical protein